MPTMTMLTRDDVLAAVKAGRESKCIDGRDFSRLLDWFPLADWKALGAELKEGALAESVPPPKPWTWEAFIEQMRDDVEFGFQKALNKRGISASLMNDCVKLWLWILGDELADHDDYPQYGLPLLKAVAVKYGFPNSIGDDDGNESKYASD